MIHNIMYILSICTKEYKIVQIHLRVPDSVPTAWLGLTWHSFTGFKLILASKLSQVTSQPIKPWLMSLLGKCVIQYVHFRSYKSP